ncbi:MAG: NIF3 1 [Anaerolineae bacterium]
MSERVMIVVTVPPDAVDAVLDAIAGAGGGVIGNYTHCAFTSAGAGRFKPEAGATPHVGAVEEINSVDEVRIETFAGRAQAKAVVAAIRAAHPYEEPVIYIIPLLSEEEL